MEPQPADLSHLLRPILTQGHDLSGGIEPLPHHTGAPGESHSVRVVEHDGHRIRIETTYRIFIDEQPFPDPIHVNDDGTVHYHGLPQYSVPSAVDLVKLIVDRMEGGQAPPLIGEEHHHHGQQHDHGGGCHGGPHDTNGEDDHTHGGDAHGHGGTGAP